MILSLTAVLAAAVVLAALYRCAVAIALPTAMFYVILLLFAFGAVDLLFLGWVAVCLLISVGALATLVIRWRERGLKPLLSWIFGPSVAIYLILLAIFGFSVRGMRFVRWDEFSHWGSAVAAMVRTDALPPYSSVDLLLESYPPALPVWEYFLANLRRDFVESDVHFAYQVFCLALLLPFAARLRWRSPRHLVFFAVSSVLLVATFSPLDAVIVDPALGMAFGYCCALALVGSLDGRNVWRHLGPAVAVLALIKEIGVLFALIAVSLLVIRVGLRRRQHTIQALSRVPLAILHGIIGLVCIAVPTLVWRLVVSVSGASAGRDAVALGDALAPLVGAGETWRNQATAAFVLALSNEPISGSPFPLAFWGWFGLSLVLLTATDHVRSWVVDDGRMWPVPKFPATSVMLGGALVYAAALWFAYMTVFSEGEAMGVASISRYLMTYWRGVLFVCLAVALVALGSKAMRVNGTPSAAIRMWSVTLAALLLCVSQIEQVAALLGRQQVASAQSMRAPTDFTAEQARRAGVDPTDRVWILSQYSNGFEYYILGYDFLENGKNVVSDAAEDCAAAGWSLGPPKDEADIWTCDLTVREWSEDLESFDYVVVHHTEPVFVERYGSMFEDPDEIQDGAVFSVESSSTGLIQLVSANAP